MIKPTLFIGLGTTGTQILKVLRDLMSEEYNNSGLPIFRYVAIETREAETGDNPRQFEDYEQITVVNATIDETAPIRNKVNSDHPHYNPHLADWLNPQLLNQIQSFKDGACNIRMAGRLCLWENWENILRTLTNAHNNVIASDNIQATSDILRQHYAAKHLDVPHPLVDYHGINVYVVGTLCGGSCSGMLIDMAYFLRTLLGGSMHNKIYGIFTMYDYLLAASYDEEVAVHAANCYAGLSELNYYNHSDTIYDVTFPKGQRVNTKQKPFDYTMVVSPTGKWRAIRFVAGGEVDENGMNLMVALNLFAEVPGDTDGGLKPVPSSKTPTMVKCLASFGLTAVWYPKYRIASAAACYASKALCTSWQGKHTYDANIKADAIKEWENIIENADILTSPQVAGQLSLINEIRSLLDIASKAFNREISSEELMQEMNAFPGGEIGPFRSMFAEGGKYFAWMKAKVDNCQKAFLNAIDQLLDNQLAKVDTHGTYGLGDVRVFFEELTHTFEQTLQRCPSQLPILDLNELNFEPMRSAEKNIWTKLAGNQEKAVKAHRERLIEEYHQLIVGKEGIFQKVRNYFLRQILEASREKLGFEVHIDGTTIKQQLDQIEVNLKHCERELQEEYEYVITQPRSECVKIVTNNPQNSIEIDAEYLANQIINNITSEEFLVDNGYQTKMADFLKKGREGLMLQMTETYRRVALNKINDGVGNGLVVTKAQEILNTDGDDLRDLARRSNPYIEFTPMYEPFALEPGGQIVLGQDPTGQKLDALKGSLGFDYIGNTSIDHFLFFYEEEAGFAPDDLASYELLKRHFEMDPGIYGHSTHKDPNFYNITFQHKQHKLQQWCYVLAHLVPQIWDNITPDAFGDVFRRENDRCVFEYSIDGVMTTLDLYDDLNGVERLSREENNTAYNHFFQSVKDGLDQIDIEEISHLMNESLNSVEDLSARHKLSEIYADFLNEIYLTDDN